MEMMPDLVVSQESSHRHLNFQNAKIILECAGPRSTKRLEISSVQVQTNSGRFSGGASTSTTTLNPSRHGLWLDSPQADGWTTLIFSDQSKMPRALEMLTRCER